MAVLKGSPGMQQKRALECHEHCLAAWISLYSVSMTPLIVVVIAGQWYASSAERCWAIAMAAGCCAGGSKLHSCWSLRETASTAGFRNRHEPFEAGSSQTIFYRKPLQSAMVDGG